MKPVIDALVEGKKKWSDLKGLKVEKREIPDKTLDRLLENLEYWGLVNKEDDYWVWYEYSLVLSPHNYQLAIEHSRKLLPALQSVTEIMVLERQELYSYVKEHLKSYPEIYQKLERFEHAFDERTRFLLEKHGNKIKDSSQFMIIDPVKVKGKGFLGKFVGETKWKRREVPWTIDYGHAEMTQEEFEKSEDYKEIIELRDFLEDTEKFSKRFEIYGELAGDLAVLCRKIDMGQPLEGRCLLCPKVKIVEDKR